MGSGAAIHPRSGQLLKRKRLFSELDQLLKNGSVWIGAPGGAGKTCVIASWLDANERPFVWCEVRPADVDLGVLLKRLRSEVERLAGTELSVAPWMPIMAMTVDDYLSRWFDAAWRQLPAQTVIVFDNLEDAPPHLPIGGVVRAAIVSAATPSVVAISRTAPGDDLAAVLASEALHALPADRLPLSVDETLELARQRCERLGRAYDETLALRAHEQAEGWPAGVALLLEADALDVPAAGLTAAYFQKEILGQLSADALKVLTRTACVAQVSEEHAVALAGAEAPAVLAELANRNYLVHRLGGGDFRVHPLLRSALLTEFAEFDDAGDLQRRAAKVSEQKGDVGDAARLLVEAGEVSELADLVGLHGATALAEGRHLQLMSWFQGLPASLVRKRSSLRLLRGLALSATDPPRGIAELEATLESCRRDGDRVSALQAWAALGDLVTMMGGGVSPLITPLDFLDEWPAPDTLPVPPPLAAQLIASVVSVLMMRAPGDPRCARWVAAGDELSGQMGDPAAGARLAQTLKWYSTWFGDYEMAARADVALQPLRDDDTVGMDRVMLYSIDANAAVLRGEFKEALSIVDEGLPRVQASGVGFAAPLLLEPGAFACVGAGWLDRLPEYLKPLEAVTSTRIAHRAAFECISGIAALLEGEPVVAARHLRAATAAAEELAAPFVTLVSRALLASAQVSAGLLDQARETLMDAQPTVERLPESFPIALMEIAASGLARAASDSRAEREHAVRAMGICRRMELTHFTGWQPDAMARVCYLARQVETERGWADTLIRRRNLEPDDAASGCDDWPWRVLIRTQGKFEVTVDGEHLQLPGRGRELLAAIASHGGEVRVVRLVDSLWPESEGDAAHNAFKVTLHRLRKALPEGMLMVRDGTVQVDSTRCWVEPPQRGSGPVTKARPS